MSEQSTEGAITWGHSQHGLTLGLVAEGATLRLLLKDIGDAPLEVLSHVQAQDVHLDWYTVRLKDAQGHERTIRFVEDRDRSAQVKAHLEPGKSLEHTVALGDWASRAANGGQSLAAGTYQVTAAYEVKPESAGGCWSGRLEAGPAKMNVATK